MCEHKMRNILAGIGITGILLCACQTTQPAAPAPENTGNGAGQAAMPDAAPSVSANETEEEEVKAPAEYVAGSGGYFVKLTDGIYFHDYEKEAFEELARDGNLLAYCLTPSEATTLCRYDEESGEVTGIVRDGSTGRLYWLGDRFYSERYGENGSEIVTITPEGECEVYGPGRIAGTPETYTGSAEPQGKAADTDASGESDGVNAGGALAVWRFGTEGTTLEVLDSERLTLYTMGADEIDYNSYCGLDGTAVIYRLIGEEGLVTLYSYDGTKSTRLGDLTKAGVYADPRCEQLFEANGRVYCVMGWHSGVYDDYKEFQTVSFVPGQEDSLEVLLEGYDVLSMPKIEAYRAPHFETQDGSVSMNGQIPDTVSLSEGDCGDLVLYRSPEVSVTVAEDLISYQDRESLKILASQVFGEDLYLMAAGVEYVPEADYEWQRFYRFDDRMYYLKLKIPASGASPVYGRDAECIYGADWKAAYSFDTDYYEDFIGAWQISEIPAEASAEDGEEAGNGRRESTRTTVIEFTDDRHAVVSQDIYVGGIYEISSETVEGQEVISGFCPLFGHHFTAWFENGELNVTFIQRMLSTWGDETKTWTGFYVTAPEEEEVQTQE